ncbi:hypothetical protein [Alkalihalobacterium chitinilyticum]|uniref:Uncharacterized protein n=1 Tax=Alkalihalobacterium chitinilyticum TaxID=2980103 RepID=A0ABT5VFP2_9BACI|nr:hypothetical protein [Alkalihalobacterium chitinilyticum]MDE5414274.1 hypothetical protein [Alkalihalobacterium chitinilyticum]
MSNEQDYIQFNENKIFIANSAVEKFSEEFVEIHYRYENGKLVKQ